MISNERAFIVTTRSIVFLFLGLAVSLMLCSCSSPWVTNTPRSAIEEYLVSTTIERGVSHANFMNFSGKKAFMDYDYFAPQVDKAYAQGVIEGQISKAQVIITRKAEEADVIIQPLCGVLGTDYNKLLIGTPALPIPVPDTGISVVIPEIPLFCRYIRIAYGTFSFNVFDAKDRKLLESIDMIRSSARYINWVVLLVPFQTYDMDMANSVTGSTTYEFFE